MTDSIDVNTNGNLARLNTYYRQVNEIILQRQDWVSGLLPASTAVNIHGNYTDAWVRDNVYSILSAWGLALAYRRFGEAEGKAYLLEQSVVKLMRGLLTAMMRQAVKVERFKHTQDPLDALHAKYDTQTGGVVVGDSEWGHLQLDATSLFLLMLAQMTASGLRIIFTIDEVNFVQNLVHYISRTYRTPDYGIWERGNKINHGIAELNASSIGMAKAALEAMSGFNLFGKDGGQTAVIHVISDDIARTRIALESLLPRESLSKEVDSSVLSVIGFPAFAVDNDALRNKTEQLIVDKLQGRYGCKRFLLDGHQTEIEDSHRLYYDPHELKQFMHIECEWPLFFTYLLLHRLCSGNTDGASEYREKIETLLVERNGQKLLPELYIVPRDLIDEEKAVPHSQARVPNENVPLVWAQSLYMLGCLIQDGLLTIGDIDPLGRHKPVRHGQTATVQFALLSEDEAVQRDLLDSGIPTQTLAEIAPIQVREANELANAFTQVGRNDRIGLTGRPYRQLRTLATSQIYVLANQQLVFLPQLLSQKGFYLAMDNRLLIQRLRLELSYVCRHWDRQGNPLMVMTIKRNMLKNHGREVLIDFIGELQSGLIKNIPVCLGPLSELAAASCYEKIDYLHDFQFTGPVWDNSERPFAHLLPGDDSAPMVLSAQSAMDFEISDDAELIDYLKTGRPLHGQLEALSQLACRHGLDYMLNLTAPDAGDCSVKDLLEEIYAKAGDQHVWDVVRRCAGLLGKYDINLEQAATEILVRQHQLTVGRAYSGKATLKRPVDSSEILQTIRAYNSTGNISEQILIQELIIYLGMLIKSDPELFADMHTIRIGHILQLLLVTRKRLSDSTLDQAFNEIVAMPPHQLAAEVEKTLKNYSEAKDQLGRVELLHFDGERRELASARFSPAMDASRDDADDWYEWRERQGSVGRENDTFFASVWDILHHCKGLMIGEKFNSNRRLDSESTLAQMTSGEQSFKLFVIHLLNKIQAPVYRQLTVEAIWALASIFRENPALQIDDTLIIDVIIGHGVRLNWLASHPETQSQYEERISFAWQAFYQLPPHKVANAMLDAMIHLLDNNQNPEQEGTI